MFDNPRKELEKKMQDEGRLPPGQSLTRKFPVLHYGSVPNVDLATWTLRAFGLVEEEKTWTWEEFQKLPTIQITCDIHCVTRWSMFDATWEGVLFRDFVALAKEMGLTIERSLFLDDEGMSRTIGKGVAMANWFGEQGVFLLRK